MGAPDFFKDGEGGNWQNDDDRWIKREDMANYKTYTEICADVCRAMGDVNSARIAEVQAVVNMVYLNEVCVCDELNPLYWLMDLIDDIKTKAKAAITGISKANPASVTSAAHGFATGDVIQIAGVVGMTELNNRHFVVVRTAAGTYTLKDLYGTDVNSTDFTDWASGGYAYHRGVTFAKNFRVIKSANFHGYSTPLTPISLNQIEQNTSWIDTGTLSQPTRYLHKAFCNASGDEWQRFLWFTLPSAVYSARVWGERIPDRLSAGTDVPVLPARYHDALVSGSVARLTQYGQVQIENAVIWPGIYKIHIEAIRAENRKWWRENTPDQRSATYLL